jgi:hypothetical protein
MVRLLSLVRRRPVACLTGAALLVGAVLAVWLLAYRETLVPVTGTVTVDGKPLQTGMVTFYPNHSKGNAYLRGAGGKIKDGMYELWTYDKKGEAKKGISPGWYRVVVEGFAASDRGTAAKTSRNGKIVEKAIIHGSAGKEISAGDDIWTPPPAGDPKDFFSNYNKPQAVEVRETGDSYDLELQRPAPKRERVERK